MNSALMININAFSVIKQECYLIPIGIKPNKFLRIVQGLRILWSSLLMTFLRLYNSKGPSAVCQQKFRTALTPKYLHGLSSFKSQFL